MNSKNRRGPSSSEEPASSEEPSSYEEVVEKKEWKDAMVEEY